MEFVNRKDEPKFKIQIVAPKDAQGLALFRARSLILARKKPERSEARSSLVAVRQMPSGHLSERVLRMKNRRNPAPTGAQIIQKSAFKRKRISVNKWVFINKENAGV